MILCFVSLHALVRCGWFGRHSAQCTVCRRRSQSLEWTRSVKRLKPLVPRRSGSSSADVVPPPIDRVRSPASSKHTLGEASGTQSSKALGPESSLFT